MGVRYFGIELEIGDLVKYIATSQEQIKQGQNGGLFAGIIVGQQWDDVTSNMIHTIKLFLDDGTETLIQKSDANYSASRGEGTFCLVREKHLFENPPLSFYP